jgi:hypothetical protein
LLWQSVEPEHRNSLHAAFAAGGPVDAPADLAAAVPFAAWLASRVPGRHPCLVLCGANTDWHPA